MAFVSTKYSAGYGQDWKPFPTTSTSMLTVSCTQSVFFRQYYKLQNKSTADSVPLATATFTAELHTSSIQLYLLLRYIKYEDTVEKKKKWEIQQSF